LLTYCCRPWQLVKAIAAIAPITQRPAANHFRTANHFCDVMVRSLSPLGTIRPICLPRQRLAAVKILQTILRELITSRLSPQKLESDSWSWYEPLRLRITISGRSVCNECPKKFVCRLRHLVYGAIEGGFVGLGGFVKPLSLRTNCSDDAWISSSVAGGLKIVQGLNVSTHSICLPIDVGVSRP